LNKAIKAKSAIGYLFCDTICHFFLLFYCSALQTLIDFDSFSAAGYSAHKPGKSLLRSTQPATNLQNSI
jgi:hypothetical protein